MRAGGWPHRWPSPNTCCVNPQWEGVSCAYLTDSREREREKKLVYICSTCLVICELWSRALLLLFCVWDSDVMPGIMSPAGNARFTLASGERIFRSPVWVSDAPLSCQCVFLSGDAAERLLSPTPHHLRANPSLGAGVGTADDLPTIGCR